MGKKQFKKIEEIRAYYDENNKVNSDYDQIFPITVFAAVKETDSDDSPSLNDKVNNFNTRMTRLESTTEGVVADVGDVKAKSYMAMAAIDSWQKGVLNPEGGPGSFIELQQTVDQLDATSLKTNDFGDGKYVKSITVEKLSDNQVSFSHNIENITDGTSKEKKTIIHSSDDSIEFNVSADENIINVDITTLITKDAFDNKLDMNPVIVPGTGTKITYDAKGLVTGSSPLEESDIPDISASKIIGLENELASKADKTDIAALMADINTNTENIAANTTDISQLTIDLQYKLTKNDPIKPGTFTKVLVDEKGLVTGGTDISINDIPEIPISHVTGLQASLDTKVGSDTISGLQSAINSRVIANPEIAPGTGTKVTFDSKGLITHATNLTASDIPVIEINQVNGLREALTDIGSSEAIAEIQNELNTKLTANNPIVAGTGIKVTYDEKGLITGSSNITTEDIPEDFKNRVSAIETTIPEFASKESIENLTTIIDSKITANKPITAGSAVKVVFDSKGLIVGTESLIKSDLPEIEVADISGLSAALAEKASTSDLTAITQDIAAKAPQSSVDALNNQISTINTTLTHVNDDIAQVNTKMSAVELTATQVSDGLNDMSQKVDEIDNSLTQNNNQLNTIKADLYENGTYLKSRVVAGNNVTIVDEVVDGVHRLKINAEVSAISIDNVENLSSELSNKADVSTVSNLSSIVSGHSDSILTINSTLGQKLTANNPIAGGTGIKVTYDEKGLILSSESLSKEDLPTLETSDISGLNDALANLANNQIPAGGKPGDVLLMTENGFVWKSLEELVKSIIDDVSSYEDTPNASIDFINETIKSLIAGAEYTINNVTYTADTNGSVSIDSAWFGKSVNIVKKSSAPNKIDSKAQTLEIPTKPTTPAITTTPNGGDLINVTTNMEYRLSPNGTWISVTSSPVTGLDAGTYNVRIKAVDGVSFAGTIVTVEVTSGETSKGWTLTYDFPGNTTVITSTSGRIPLSSWTGYDGSQVLDENVLYDENLASMDDIKVRLYAKFVTDSEFKEVFFDNFGQGIVATNSLQRWGYVGDGDYIQIIGSNSTGVKIELKLVKEA